MKVRNSLEFFFILTVLQVTFWNDSGQFLLKLCYVYLTQSHPLCYDTMLSNRLFGICVKIDLTEMKYSK